MSHRDDCPSYWEARSEGHRAGYRGYGSNPYRPDPWGESGCPDAERAWRSGYYAGEERRQEEDYAQRLEERHQQERAEEEESYQQEPSMPAPDMPTPEEE